MATIIVDTRQQEGKHDLKHEQLEARGFVLLRHKLPYGDYAILPPIAVDTKRDIAELAYDSHNDHARPRRECVGARDYGMKLVILTENTEGITSLGKLSNWREPRSQFVKRKYARQPIDGSRLAKACYTMTRKYGVIFDFCEPDETADRIIELLTGGESIV